MSKIKFSVSCDVKSSARVQQLAAMFDVKPEVKAAQSWEIEVPLEQKPWQVGLVTGPSGSGKSTVARHLWPEQMARVIEWDDAASLVDNFQPGLGIREVTNLLGGVGLSSPPSWLRPYRTLSNGEAFRADIARRLAELEDDENGEQIAVVDEFTSLVDRQVAQVASHTIQKAVRASSRKLVAVTCHYDVLEWLQPDWVLDMARSEFAWRTVQRHPQVKLTIRPVEGRTIWPAFAHHHYLSSELNRSARCYVAFTEAGDPVCFGSYLHVPHKYTRNIKQAHRIVTLPDWQGLGIGMRMAAWMGEHLWKSGYRFHLTSAHPAIFKSCARSPRWSEVTQQGKSNRTGGKALKALAGHARSMRKFSCRTFEYRPEAKVAGERLPRRSAVVPGERT